MSDTPETDRQWAEWLNKLKMPIESFVAFARRLERERNELRDAFADESRFHNRTHGELVTTQCALTDARAALKRITECDMRWSKKIARDALKDAK